MELDFKVRAEIKHNLNQKVNKLLTELLKLLKDSKSKEYNDKVNTVIKKLEQCAKTLESQFLDDLVYVFKFLLYDKGEKE